MQIYYVYHVVTEQPMHIGQKIKFDKNNQSGVYKRVMKEVELVKDIYDNPYNYDLKTLNHHTKVALRELAIEKVRLEKYPHYPSKLSSLYVTNTKEEALIWADYFISLGRNVYGIVLLKVSGPKFTGDAHNCFEGTTNELENLRLAKRYWQNEKNNKNTSPLLETIVNGDIEVIEIIKEYPMKNKLSKN